MKTYVLFDNRHEVPPNEGPLCEGFSFKEFTVRKSTHWNRSLEYLEGGGTVHLYVTGLTPALTAYLQ